MSTVLVSFQTFHPVAGVAKLVDARDSKSRGEIRAGSSPAPGTTHLPHRLWAFKTDSLFPANTQIGCEQFLRPADLLQVNEIGENVEGFVENDV